MWVMWYNISVNKKGSERMEELENTILKSFKKYMGKEVNDLDLIVYIEEDYWPDPDSIYNYCCEVMESKDNGRVWTCTCTKNGRVKDACEL